MKLTITRLLETSKFLATEVGQAIPGFFDYMAEFVEQVTRSLRGGLTFADNFDAEVKTVSLVHDTEQIISATKTVAGIIPLRVVSKTTSVTAFGWHYNDQNSLVVKASFLGGDLASSKPVVIVLLF
jgi:hypothetical protein